MESAPTCVVDACNDPEGFLCRGRVLPTHGCVRQPPSLPGRIWNPPLRVVDACNARKAFFVGGGCCPPMVVCGSRKPSRADMESAPTCGRCLQRPGRLFLCRGRVLPPWFVRPKPSRGYMESVRSCLQRPGPSGAGYGIPGGYGPYVWSMPATTRKAFFVGGGCCPPMVVCGSRKPSRADMESAPTCGRCLQRPGRLSL